MNMQIPFFELNRLNEEEGVELINAFQNFLKSGRYILGPEVDRFEKHLHEILSKNPEDCGGVIGCNSGTDALILSLLASEVGIGDEVLTVSHTAIPTLAAIRAVGALPIFIDIDPDTWLMDTTGLNDKITPKTKAIILVHLYGNVLPVPDIIESLKTIGRTDIAVIEDVAQAQGACYHGQAVGTMGRMGAFSFYPTKNLGALGDGGAVYCSKSQDAVRVRALRSYGQENQGEVKFPRGINSRLDEIQATILNLRLNHFKAWNDKKAVLMEKYQHELKGMPIHFQKVLPGTIPAWHLCVIKLNDNQTRDHLRHFLAQSGIETLIHYPRATHTQTPFSFTPTSLPITENLTERILSLPLNSALKDLEQDYIIQKIKEYFDNRRAKHLES